MLDFTFSKTRAVIFTESDFVQWIQLLLFMLLTHISCGTYLLDASVEHSRPWCLYCEVAKLHKYHLA